MNEGSTRAPLRVLVVEDDPAVARLVVRRLKGEAFSVTCVHDVKSAFEQLDATVFDVVWSDLDLGGDKDGVDVLTYAAVRSPAAALLLVTGAAPAIGSRQLPKAAQVFEKDRADPAFSLVFEVARLRRAGRA